MDTSRVGSEDPKEVSMVKTSRPVQPYPAEFRVEAIRLARTTEWDGGLSFCRKVSLNDWRT